MTGNRIKMLFVMGVAVAAMAGCKGGQAETDASQAPDSQAVAPQTATPAAAADIAAGSAAKSAMSDALKGTIAMHAQASVPALACGLETKASLDASKAEVRKLARAEGIGDATFDQVYAAGERKTRARWDSAPAAKRASACQEWKTMAEQAEAQARTL